MTRVGFQIGCVPLVFLINFDFGVWFPVEAPNHTNWPFSHWVQPMHLLIHSHASSQCHSLSSGPSLVTDAVFLGPYYLLAFIYDLSSLFAVIINKLHLVRSFYKIHSSSMLVIHGLLGIFMSSLSELKLSSNFHLEFQWRCAVKGISLWM